MPRFPRVQGPSTETVVQRFDPAVPRADATRAAAVEIAAHLEERRATGLRREISRLTHKHGEGSEPVRRAQARLVAHTRNRAVLDDEVARVRIGPVDPGPNAVIIHGRVLDQERAPLSKLTAAIADENGTLLLTTTTDETGYFRLDSGSSRDPKQDPRQDPKGPTKGPTKGPATRLTAASFARRSPLDASQEAAADEPARGLRLLVLEGEREIHREELAELFPGEARYREIVIDRRSRGPKTRR
jgi:hypothetical protein